MKKLQRTIPAMLMMGSVAATMLLSAAPARAAHALDIKAITAKPTADNPRYDNKKTWPTLVGDEYFQKQKWPKARLLIWNIRGSAEKVGGRRGGLDGRTPANWINAATGQPAKSVPDMDTDMILPDSDTPYTVDFWFFSKRVAAFREVLATCKLHSKKNLLAFLGCHGSNRGAGEGAGTSWPSRPATFRCHCPLELHPTRQPHRPI